MSSSPSYHQHDSRPRPHLSIPQSADTNSHLYRSPSTGRLPSSYSSNPQQQAASQADRYDGDKTPVRRTSKPTNSLYAESAYSPYAPYPTNGFPMPSIPNYTQTANYYQHDQYGYGGRPSSYTEGSGETSSYNPEESLFAFPEPDLNRRVSARAPVGADVQPGPLQRSSVSDQGPATQLSRTISQSSSYSTYTPTAGRPDPYRHDSLDLVTDELSRITLESEEGLRRFQAGELSAVDEEWHKLVPETAREALGKDEVIRQSNIFELFKAEREYVSDLEAVFDVFVQPLRIGNVIKGNVEEFIHEVFWNLHDVLTFHQRMLAALFARQRDQHPLIQSISDIILETALQFTGAYESYIKHYPLSEARHRSELKNKDYRDFMQKAIQDKRIRKRDLVTFISRPVTRLPRLSLVLETMLKHTDGSHPDQETVPLVISILGDFIKSTQPGIEAAESKVKFWNVMENLVFRRGEIIDLDEQDESRTLVHSQTLARRQRSELDWSGWNDYFVALLDHYFIIAREDKRPGGVVKYEVTSRPIPLEFLRLGQFDGPPENRKEKSEEGGILDSLRSNSRPQYPFTIYHEAAKLNRRYTFYTNTESGRAKWFKLLNEAIGIHSIRQDSNKWFAPNTINDNIFRIRSTKVPPTSADQFTGMISAAAAFTSGGKNYMIVGCAGGVYVGIRGEFVYRRVLSYRNANAVFAIPKHNKILIHADETLFSYSMDMIARASQNATTPKALDASMERVSGQDKVSLAKVGFVKGRSVVMYAVKGFRQTTMHALEVVDSISRPNVRQAGGSMSFRPFGEPFYVPRQAFNVTPLTRTVTIATERGVTIIDPTNVSSAGMLVVPDFSQVSQDVQAAALKSKCDESKALGLARVDVDRNMVVYEEFGCYINRHGLPSLNSSIVRWEVKADAFAERWEHILLFSSDFIEIRQKASGRLVQVINGKNIRLLNIGTSNDMALIVARLGTKNDQHGQSDELFELLKTSVISAPSANSPTNREEYWGEWDM